jgi:hypothetical protein
MYRAHIVSGLAAGLCACGGPDVTPPGPGITFAPPPAWVVGPHGALPQVPNNNGPILKNVDLVTVTFANDPQACTDNAFADFVVSSNWLSIVGQDYGVGRGQHVGSNVLTLNCPPPTSLNDSDIQATLVSALEQNTLMCGSTACDVVTDPNLLILVFVPSTISVTLDYPQGQNSGTSCTVWGGYHHGGQTAAGQPFPYAVVADCPGVASAEGVTEEQFIQLGASHEIIESATDPLTINTLSWTFPLNSTSPWLALGAEVADLCATEIFGATESGFSLVRVWSNSAAMNGTDPCIPAPAGPFYDTSGPSQYVVLSAGQSTQIPLQGWSTGPTQAWPIRVDAWPGGSFQPDNVSLSQMTLTNGQQATLTVGVPSGTPGNQVGVLMILSGSSDADLRPWPIVVVSQ